MYHHPEQSHALSLYLACDVIQQPLYLLCIECVYPPELLLGLQQCSILKAFLEMLQIMDSLVFVEISLFHVIYNCRPCRFFGKGLISKG